VFQSVCRVDLRQILYAREDGAGESEDVGPCGEAVGSAGGDGDGGDEGKEEVDDADADDCDGCAEGWWWWLGRRGCAGVGCICGWNDSAESRCEGQEE